ncbi:hypothetical protein BDBG_16254, partial [Blastomyces gilchristii SLH14081]
TNIFILIHIKSSYINRSIFTDNHDLNVKLLIENLRDVIMKKLSILYMTESFISLSILSVSFSAALSQSFISVSASDSPAFTTSVSVILTSATSALSAFIISAFIISSFYFKKMLHRLNESCFSVYILSFFLSISKIIYCIKT